MSLEDRTAYSASVRDFLWNNKPLPAMFSPREQLHLKDVRVLFAAGTVVMLIALVLLALSATLGRPQKIIALVHGTARTALYLILAAAIFVLLGFDQIFLWFHSISFRNDFWLLDPVIHILIRVYPPQYFFYF